MESDTIFEWTNYLKGQTDIMAIIWMNYSYQPRNYDYVRVCDKTRLHWFRKNTFLYVNADVDNKFNSNCATSALMWKSMHIDCKDVVMCNVIWQTD